MIHLCTGLERTTLTLSLAKYLVTVGADVNAINRLGETPLFEPTLVWDDKAINFLMANGARVSFQNNDGIPLIALARNTKDTLECYMNAMHNEIKEEREQVDGIND